MSKGTVSGIMLTLLVTSTFMLAFNIQPVKAIWVSDLPIPYLPFASEVTIDGEITEEAWCHADHFHNYSVHKKTIEFDVYLMHDSMSLYIGAKIHENDFWSTGWLPDSFEVEINDRNDGHYGGDSGNDIKRMWVTATGLGNYEDKYVPHDQEPDVTVDGEGSFIFSGARQDGEIGDYYFEMRIPINGTHPEDAEISEGFPFGMMISFCDYDSDENVGYGYWLLQGSYVLTAPKTWTVDDDGSADFHTIQEAVNAANDGDTIFVRKGVYYENVVVNKTVSLIGENRSNTIIDGSRIGTVVKIAVDNVTLYGFTIQHSKTLYPPGGYSGVYLDHSTRCNISYNIVRDNYYGISLEYSDANIIFHNTLSHHLWHGIRLINAHKNIIIGNNASHNWNEGIYSFDSNNNLIASNIMTDNNHGIYLLDSSNTRIIRNILAHNSFSEYSTGISLYSNNCTLLGNLITENSCGMGIPTSNNLIYHNNLIQNVQQVHLINKFENTWDDGYPSGGNYWSDYEERYPNATELDGSGIWDTPYIVGKNNQDSYPLMEVWGVVSGNLQILKPVNGSVIVGSISITFTIENTGCNIAFAKGDFFNRIDLEIEYQPTDGETHGWGIVPWSTSDHGLILHSGEKHTQTVLYDPSEYEEAVPLDLIEGAPYGEATIRLVHWKQMDGGYSYGEFGMTEINVAVQPDTTPPTITFLSPENRTYTSTSLPLAFTVDETTSWIGYSLDNQANVTITGNTTLAGIPEGIHSITVYANDTAGNIGASETVYFAVALPCGPTATFTITSETADVGESIKFDASSSLPGWNGTHEMPISEYRWDFSDGNQTTTFTPIVYHSFSSSGNYYVTLTVYAPRATPETGSTTHKVTVISVPVGGYSYPIKGYTTDKPLTLYLALVAILTVSLTMIKRKKHRRGNRA